MDKISNKVIIFNASVVSRKGISSLGNTNNFYINGRYMYEHESDAVQVTIEKRSSEGLFAICNGMNGIEHKDNHIVSVIKELDKYSRKVNNFKVDIRSKLEMLSERVMGVHNLAYSMTLDDSYLEENSPSFSGLIISDGKAAAINIGDTAVFLFRNGVLKQLTTDYTKPQRLLKMGIITKDIKNKSDLQLSDIIDAQDEDIFVLCSEGVAEALDDEQIKSLLTVQDEEIDYLTVNLANEATYNGAKRDLTVMVIKIKHEAIPFQDEVITDNTSEHNWSDKLLAIYEKKQEALRTFIVAALTCVVIAGIAFATPLILNSRKAKVTTAQPTTTITPKTSSAVTSTSPKPSQSPSTKPSASISTTPTITPTPKPSATVASASTIKPTPTETVSPKPSTTPGSTPINSAEQTYIVSKGDTLFSISKKFYDDTQYYKLIMERNNIKDANEIVIGQKLIIPQK